MPDGSLSGSRPTKRPSTPSMYDRFTGVAKVRRFFEGGLGLSGTCAPHTPCRVSSMKLAVSNFHGQAPIEP